MQCQNSNLHENKVCCSYQPVTCLCQAPFLPFSDISLSKIVQFSAETIILFKSVEITKMIISALDLFCFLFVSLCRFYTNQDLRSHHGCCCFHHRALKVHARLFLRAMMWRSSVVWLLSAQWLAILYIHFCLSLSMLLWEKLPLRPGCDWCSGSGTFPHRNNDEQEHVEPAVWVSAQKMSETITSRGLRLAEGHDGSNYSGSADMADHFISVGPCICMCPQWVYWSKDTGRIPPRSEVRCHG